MASLVHTKKKMKMISKVKEKYKGADLPFIAAAGDGNVEDVRILLSEDGMDMNQTNKHWNTALHWASFNGHIDVVNLLLQHPNLKINQQDNDGVRRHIMEKLKLSNHF